MRLLFVCTIAAALIAVGAWAVSPPEADSGSARVEAAPPVAPIAPQARKSARADVVAPAQEPAKPLYDVALLSPQPLTPAVPVQKDSPKGPEAKAPSRERKAFQCPPGTPGPAPLTLAQIARIKTSLNLTSEQEKHWRPLEAALTDIARRLEAEEGGNRKFTLTVERSQQLYFMAGPLVTRLRDEQKRAARNLACAMGHTLVAALI